MKTIRFLFIASLLLSLHAIAVAAPPSFRSRLKVTIAEVAKAAGCTTATFGKWGMGFFDTSGSPQKQGVDHFFGFTREHGGTPIRTTSSPFTPTVSPPNP